MDYELQALTTCIRRVARLLWSVHLSFQEGFDKVSILFPNPLPFHCPRSHVNCVEEQRNVFSPVAACAFIAAAALSGLHIRLAMLSEDAFGS